MEWPLDVGARRNDRYIGRVDREVERTFSSA